MSALKLALLGALRALEQEQPFQRAPVPPCMVERRGKAEIVVQDGVYPGQVYFLTPGGGQSGAA